MGTDHKLSLEPIELQQLITRIRSIETQFNVGDDDDKAVLEQLAPLLNATELNEIKIALRPIQSKQIQPCEMECRSKLGKSLVYRGNLKIGTTLSAHDICVKVSEPFGISAEHFDEFIGKTLAQNVFNDGNLAIEHFDN